MWKVARIPAGDITNLHYNLVVAKPLLSYNSCRGINIKKKSSSLIWLTDSDSYLSRISCARGVGTAVAVCITD